MSILPGRVCLSAIFVGFLLGIPSLILAADESPIDIQRDLVYAEAGGKALLADIYSPRGVGPFPGVLVVHGGAWMLGSKSHVIHVATYLAEHGYTGGRDQLPARAANLPFRRMIDDCKAAVRRWMK